MANVGETMFNNTAPIVTSNCKDIIEYTFFTKPTRAWPDKEYDY